MNAETQLHSVSEYYGETLQSSADLKTSACCPIDAVPAHHRALLAKLHPTVTSRFYGCGSPIPDALEAATVLDLGCGTGRDAFLAAALAGPRGFVIGLDMTPNQLRVARDLQQWHADAFFGPGTRPNTDFRHGYIEDLRAAGLEDATVDVVISNCVCNLSPDKKAVFSEVARVLKDGGEFYFSDVYADRRLSPHAQAHPVLVAECLGGALYVQDFRRVMAQAGLNDLRVMSSGPVEIHNQELKRLVPDVRFFSVTVRAFKVAALEDRREDYGQTATYTSCCGGTFKLDTDFTFEKGVATPVDANTAAILQKSRFADKFDVTERGAHKGLFAPEMEGGALAAAIMKPESSSCCPPAKADGHAEGAAKSAVESATETEPETSSGCSPAEPAGDKLKSAGSCCGPKPSDVIAQPATVADVKQERAETSRTCC